MYTHIYISDLDIYSFRFWQNISFSSSIQIVCIIMIRLLIYIIQYEVGDFTCSFLFSIRYEFTFGSSLNVMLRPAIHVVKEAPKGLG